MMSPWSFDAYMDGVVREVNVRLLGKGLELLSANGGRFEWQLMGLFQTSWEKCQPTIVFVNLSFCIFQMIWPLSR